MQNQFHDEKPIKHPDQLKKGKCKLPEKLIENAEERKEQIRSFAKIIVDILLADHLKEQL